MPSDFGDEAGGKLLDWMLRIGQDATQDVMVGCAEQLAETLRKTRGGIEGAQDAKGESTVEYAKLSLAELQKLPEYSTIKEIIAGKLTAAGVQHAIAPADGRDFLVFKVSDAPEVDGAFRELEEQTGRVAEQAKAELAKIRAAERKAEPLEKRAERARPASRAHAQSREASRGAKHIGQGAR
jgi:hypothetical protein